MGDEILSRQTWTIQARESSYGTDEIDLATNNGGSSNNLRFEQHSNVSVVHNGDFRERDIMRSSFSNNRGQFIRRNQTWTIEGIVPAPATAGDAPLGLDDLLVASGMSEALVDDTTATYTLSTQSTAGLTIYHYKLLADAGTATQKFTYGTGIRGTTEFTFDIRDYVRYSFTGESNNYPFTSNTADMRGWSSDLAFIDMSDGSLNLDQAGAAIDDQGTHTYPDQRGLFMETAAVLTINSAAFPIVSGSIPIGNTVSVRERTSASTTAGPVIITGRNVAPNFVFETETAWDEATEMLLNDEEQSATLVLTDGLGSGGTTVTFTFPRLQIRDVTEGEAENLVQWTMPCQANGNHTDGLGNDEMTIVWSVTA